MLVHHSVSDGDVYKMDRLAAPSRPERPDSCKAPRVSVYLSGHSIVCAGLPALPKIRVDGLAGGFLWVLLASHVE
jgi:hypothetical protein